MTIEQQQYIEQNIALIEDNEWEKFFQGYYSYGVGDILYSAGIDFLSHLTSIPRCAFLESTNLKEMYIPENITKIDDYAFLDSSNLSRVLIPNTIVDIGAQAFKGCISLEEVVFDAVSSLSTIPYAMFSYCYSLNKINIPSSVTTIDPSAFYKCEKLLSINISDAVEVIGESAFCRCRNLTSVTIDTNSKLNILHSRVFSECVSLKNISIPSTVTKIAPYAFEGCINLTDVSFRGTVEQWEQVRISPSAFKQVPNKMITCIDGVTKLRH